MKSCTIPCYIFKQGLDIGEIIQGMLDETSSKTTQMMCMNVPWWVQILSELSIVMDEPNIHYTFIVSIYAKE